MVNKLHKRRASKNVNSDEHLFAKSASLLSVNGSLQSLYQQPDHTQPRSTGYTPIVIGKPLVVRYLYHFLRLDNAGSKKQEVMISTYVKTEEEKKPAAESINYYDTEAQFHNNTCEIEGFGADVYGHELIYYTKSYVGEPIKLTTKIMELDNHDSTIKGISDAIQKVGGLPFFVEYIPYVSMVKSGLQFFSSFLKIVDRDDPIVPGLGLNLYYQRPNSPQLQSGRVVCVQGKSVQEILDLNLSLKKNNRLQCPDGSLYTETPYYVVQINNERQPSYENFEYFQNAAQLLSLTNRDGDLNEFIQTAAEGFKTYADISTIDDMEALQDDLDDPEIRAQFKAMFKGLSRDVKDIYRKKYHSILSDCE